MIDLDALDATPLERDPFDFLVVPDFMRPDGIVTLTKNGLHLLIDYEAKPLKMRISTIAESPRFCCDFD